MISAITDEVKRIKATDALNSSFVSTEFKPKSLCAKIEGTGQNTTQIKIHSSNGVFLKISM